MMCDRHSQKQAQFVSTLTSTTASTRDHSHFVLCAVREWCILNTNAQHLCTHILSFVHAYIFGGVTNKQNNTKDTLWYVNIKSHTHPHCRVSWAYIHRYDNVSTFMCVKCMCQQKSMKMVHISVWYPIGFHEYEFEYFCGIFSLSENI